VIRVMLIHPMGLLRGALAIVLSNEPDMSVAAEVARIDEAMPIATAMSAASETRPDVAVVAIDLLSNGSPVTAKAFGEAVPGCALLVLADRDRHLALHDGLDPDVHGFVGEENAPGDLARYIRLVATGQRVIDPALAVSAVFAPRSPLTDREREVLLAATSGAPSAEIADRLHLSTGTVHNYISTIIRKTGGRNRLDAIRIAEEAGWL
jgi:two-component system, NarL family, response regulator DesR